MTKEDIIRMAREAGMNVVDDQYSLLPFLEQFAALVAAAERAEMAKHCVEITRAAVTKAVDGAIALEREACAQFLESTQLGSLPDDTALHYARLLKGFAEGIRARKENT